MTLRTRIASTLLAAGLCTLPLAAQQNIEPSHNTQSNPGTAAQPYTQEQLVTATVHQAWLLSGKNEDTFFTMVQQLADLSARNREVTLPDDAAAGRRMGDYIKRTAKLDTDQLLYAVVDKAVVMITHTAPHPAASAKK